MAIPASKYTIDYFEDKEKIDLIERRKNSILTNQEHNEFVCMLANSFYGTSGSLIQKTGFKTILLEPLFDISSYLSGEQPKNFDLLLYNKTKKQLIFLEVKTSFSSIAKLLGDFKESIGVVRDKFDEKIYPKIGLKLSEYSYIDFVLVVPRGQSQPLKERIYSEGIKDAIVWDASPITSSQMEIKHDIPNLLSMKLLKQTHLDGSLRESLHNGLILKDPSKIFNFLLNSDPFQKIAYFTTLFRAFGAEEFDYQKIKSLIFSNEKSFFAYENSDESMIFLYKDLVKNLMEMESIGIKKNSDDELKIVYELKINKKFTGPSLRNSLEKTFYTTLLSTREAIIKQKAIDAHNEYHGQKSLFD